MKISITVAVLTAVVTLGSLAANATSITVTLDGPPIQSPGYTPGYSQYTYDLSTDATDHLVAGDMFTISGINGLFNALSPANFTATDNLSMGTVTYTYTGPTTGTSFSEDGFEVNTAPGYTFLTAGSFSGSATNASGGMANGSGSVLVATNVAPTPEPSSVGLLGLGMMMIGAVKSRARSVYASRN